MKTIFSTAVLFFIAGACFAAGQPVQNPGKLSITGILSFHNFNSKKPDKGIVPKVYACKHSTTQATYIQPVNQYNSADLPQTFTPSPLLNFYKEFR